MADELQVSIPGRLSEVDAVARRVEEFGDAHGLPGPKVYVINLALDELITNVVSYGFGGVAEPEIRITLRIEGGALVLIMEDNGQPFDPTRNMATDITSPLTERPIGGLGLHLVKNFADRLSYEFAEGRNRVIVEHDLASASA
jgi:anti-sigma regulatory factor (Ser/Thr protein kinase)